MRDSEVDDLRFALRTLRKSRGFTLASRVQMLRSVLPQGFALVGTGSVEGTTGALLATQAMRKPVDEDRGSSLLCAGHPGSRIEPMEALRRN